jgi:hypothetical protein
MAMFPEKNPEYFVRFKDNVGYVLTFKIVKNDSSTVLNSRVIRSAADTTHRNKRVTLKSDVQKVLGKIHTIPGAVIKS